VCVLRQGPAWAPPAAEVPAIPDPGRKRSLRIGPGREVCRTSPASIAGPCSYTRPARGGRAGHHASKGSRGAVGLAARRGHPTKIRAASPGLRQHRLRKTRGRVAPVTVPTCRRAQSARKAAGSDGRSESGGAGTSPTLAGPAKSVQSLHGPIGRCCRPLAGVLNALPTLASNSAENASGIIRSHRPPSLACSGEAPPQVALAWQVGKRVVVRVPVKNGRA